MIEFRQPSKHGFGSGMLSTDCLKFAVSIPKNASSFMVDWTGRHGWTSAIVGDDCDWHRVQQVIVLLRDPLSRWVSGITQYLSGHVLNVSNAYTSDLGPGPEDQQMSADDFIKNYNSVVERLIFDQLDELDDHVWPQTRFLNILPTVPRKHFVINNKLTQQLSQYFGFEIANDLDINQGSADSEVEKLQRFFQLRLNTRPDLIERVKYRYQQDYQYIENYVN